MEELHKSKKLIEEIYNKCGEMRLCIHWIFKDGGRSIWIQDDQMSGKEFFANTAKIFSAHNFDNLEAVMSVSEMWYKFAPLDADINSLTPPRESPDKKEGVLLRLETRTQCGTVMWDICRLGPKPILVNQVETIESRELPTEGAVYGEGARMHDIFTPHYPKQVYAAGNVLVVPDDAPTAFWDDLTMLADMMFNIRSYTIADAQARAMRN